MNIALISVVEKWVSFLLVGVLSLFSSSVTEKQKLEVSNMNENKSYSAVNEIIPYESKMTYNAKVPSTITNILVKGEVGIKTQTETNEFIIIKEPVTEIIEKGTGPTGEYVGKLTGYGPDCPGCSLVGNVACHTKTGGKHSLKTDGIYYNDEQFGEIRILSAANAFPCGTIIKVDNRSQEPFYAIVLDRGGSMNSAWKNGNVWIDLAFASIEESRNGNISSKNTKFSVQRWGY